MAEFRINVVVDPNRAVRGTRRVRNELNGLEGTANRLRGTLANAFALAGIGFSIRELIRLADAFENARNRARLVTRDVAQLDAVMGELFRISADTRSSFQATAELFNRTALATRDLGLTQRETLQFTESLNQAIILSGASAQEASAGLIQLSQGLASGTLRGDELRSVLEQLPAVADVIAQELGVTRGELRLLGQEGRISAEQVIQAFANAADELDEAFATTQVTIGQAFTVLQTRIIQFISDVNEGTGASRAFADVILLLSENIDVLAQAFAVIGSLITINFVRNAIQPAIVAVRAFSAVLLLNPLVALVTGITAAVGALILFQDEISVSTTGVATLTDVFAELRDTIVPILDDILETLSQFGQAIVNAFAPLAQFLQPVFDIFQEFFSGIEFSLAGFLRLTARILDTVVSIWLGTFNAIVEVFRTLPVRIGSFFIEAANSIIGTVETLINQIITSLNAISEVASIPAIDLIDLEGFENPFSQALRTIGEIASTAFSNSFTTRAEDAVNRFLDRVEQRAQRRLSAVAVPEADVDVGLDDRPERVERIPFALREQLRLLDEEARLLGMVNSEREILGEVLQIEERLRNQNVALTDAQFDLLEARVRNIAQLRREAELLDELTGPQQELQNRQDDLNSLLQRGAISAQQFSNELINIRLAQAELNIQQGEGSFFDGFILGIENMLEAVRNFESEAGIAFGGFFEQITDGFAQAAADAIIFGGNFEEAIGNVARRALADLLAGLIRLGLQFVLNATLGETLGGAATAAGVSQAAALSAAYAPAAAFASLASFGANAAPAATGIASTVALSQGLAAVGGFADGGFVSGPGGPRSDSIPARLSNGEFVVNARSTSRNRPLLEQINRTGTTGFQDGGIVGQAQSNARSISAGQGQNGQQGAVTVVNNFNPNLFEDFIASPRGERVILNTLERNASSAQQILRNN